MKLIFPTFSGSGNSSLKTAWWWILVLIVGAGIYFRFGNLGGKVWFTDEADTALRISGHTIKEFTDFFANAGEVRSADIQRFQKLDPTRGTWDAILSLSREEPQQVPLYYILARWWAILVGDSPTSLRAGAALLSLLAIPGILWLGRELWGDQRVTLTALALWAVSPFFVRYAQDARDYGLWGVLTLLSSASLLHALRTGRGWWIYGLFITLGLYTKFLFLGVVGAHIAFVATDRNSWTQWKQAGAAWAISLLLLGVWIGLSLQAGGTVTGLDWVKNTSSVGKLLSGWLWGVGAVACDVRSTWIGMIVAPLAAWGMFSWWRSGDRREAWFVFLLIAVNALPLALPDLMFGGRRSAVPRFLVAAWVGEILVLTWIAAPRPWLLMGLIALGGTADLVQIPQKNAWNKYNANDYQRIATLINASENPLVLFPPRNLQYGLLTLGYMLDPHVRLAPKSQVRQAVDVGDLFRLHRSNTVPEPPIEPGSEMVLRSESVELWRLPTSRTFP